MSKVLVFAMTHNSLSKYYSKTEGMFSSNNKKLIAMPKL